MDQVRSYVAPIKKKWIYHFMVSPKTSSLEKPEWYFDQTRKWIYEHIDIVESKIKLNDKSANVKHMFILCMIELVIKRLNRDMKNVSKHIEEDVHFETILIHTYNEVINFTKTIRRLLGDTAFLTLDEQYDMLSVFSNQQLFEKIVDVEWEYAEKNLRDIMNSPTRWDPVLDGEFLDTYKIPKCVDHLLMMTKAITERVECFKQLDCQFKLIELQCFLFNKFLKFLRRAAESSQKNKSNILTDILFFSGEYTIDATRIQRVLNGANFLRLALKEQYFIPSNVLENLDTSLSEKSKKLAQDYKDLFLQLHNQKNPDDQWTCDK